MDTILKYFEHDEKKVDFFNKNLGCHSITSGLLIDRGITNIKDARFFLNPNFKNLVDPFLLKDMSKAVQRIFTSIKNLEKILVFGDFDADGITSTTLLVEFLEHCDANVSWYVPHRIKEGHSLQTDHIDMAVDQDIDLIITVDCGITSHAAVEKASFEDIDVIITDHHEPDQNLPASHAVINPKRQDCNSGLDYLAGVGVAFFLVMALRKFLRDNDFFKKIVEPNLSNYLDLFAIGTIGDMVPLIDENRTFCIAGIKQIRKGQRNGLQSIVKTCGLDIQKVDSDDISFKIVPRINAAGRMSHARICVSQLISQDIINTKKTASTIDQLNAKRQQVEQDIVNDIEYKILKNPELLQKKLIFLWNNKWNRGVLGIAASRLSKKYCCPVILLSIDKKKVVGSGRSINNINIYQALLQNKSLLVKFGGHAMACGLTVEENNLTTLYDNLNLYLEKTYSENDFKKIKFINAVLDFKDINFNLAKEIDQLRPFGTANPEPLFLCKNISVKSSYLIANKHRKMILENTSSTYQNQVEAFHFNIENPDDLPDFYPLIAFKLKINKFKQNSVQIIIEEV